MGEGRRKEERRGADAKKRNKSVETNKDLGSGKRMVVARAYVGMLDPT